MSAAKAQVRARFRSAVFARDDYRCVRCGLQADRVRVEDVLDAHHVTPREEFLNGGYVVENGVSLCKIGRCCHLAAEEWLKGERNGDLTPDLDPEYLYRKIGSSLVIAQQADRRLTRGIHP